MPTRFTRRLVIVCPAAKAAAVAAWLNANVGPNAVPPDLGPPAGGDPASPYRWCSGAWTDAEAKAILTRLCALASVPPPSNADWSRWTGAEKRSWAGGSRKAVLDGFGAYVTLSQNDGAWDDPSDALTALGLPQAKLKA